MPLPSGTRYRWKTNKDGSKTRLAFAKGSNTVIETAKKVGEGKLTDAGKKMLPSSKR